jgi:hypothetical protein
VLTVLTWLWNQPGGRTKFTAEHVNIWASMVSRNLRLKHRLACVTDTPKGIDRSIEIITPPNEFRDVFPKWGPTKPNCYRRLSMFRRDAASIFGPRIACMDLDCVVGGPLDPLFDRREDLVLFKGTQSNRPYNGSMMLIRAGCRPEVYEQFNQRAANIASEGGRLMQIFGLEITRAQKTLSPPDSRGSWWPVVREPFSGAWQRNEETRQRRADGVLRQLLRAIR